MDKLSNKSIKAEDMRAFCRGEFAVNCRTQEDANLFLSICADHLQVPQPINGKWDYVDFGIGTCFFVNGYKNPKCIWSSQYLECLSIGKEIKDFSCTFEEELNEVQIPRKSRKSELSEYETKELIAEIYRRTSHGRYEL